MQFLHQRGICHGGEFSRAILNKSETAGEIQDLKPSNILLQLSDLDSLSEGELLDQIGEPNMPQGEDLFTYSGEIPGPSASEYIMSPMDLTKLNPRHFTDQIYTIDFGESYDVSAPPTGKQLGIPPAFCAPEVTFEKSSGIGCDIWALACTLYEIQTRMSLFECWNGTDDEVICQMVRLLEKLPEPWWSSWEGRMGRFDEDGSSEVWKPLIIEDALKDGVPYQIGDKNGRQVDIVVPADERKLLADLLLQMLKYDPKERASVDTVLEHPWFKLCLRYHKSYHGSIRRNL